MRCWFLIGLACWAGAAFGQAPLPHVAPGESVGTVNCASSMCHGAVSPWQDSSVLHNEYTTWLRLDKHARAYAVLLNERSQRIAKNLGLKEPAHQAKICLDCHAHTPTRPGERHQVSDGVGCEACHGPAEKWLHSHTRPGTSHADNLARGMYPTDQPQAAARLCLSCHVGDDTRFVSHRMMGAGHPRMSFELDTFSQLAPAHYRIDQDWIRRKGEPDSMKAWAIGQALAARHLLETLQHPKRGRDGLFPELVVFDCHACHHPMSDKKWRPSGTLGPGVVRLNDSHLLMLRALVRAVDAARAPAFEAQIVRLQQALSQRGEAVMSEAAQLVATLGDLVGVFERTRFDPAQQKAVLRALIEAARAGGLQDYADAEQAYLAITSLANTLARRGVIAAPAANRALGVLRQTLADDEKFNAGAFSQALEKFKTAVLVKGP